MHQFSVGDEAGDEESQPLHFFGEQLLLSARGADKDDRFINEIIRLRDLGLVKKRIDYAMYDIPTRGNLKDYIEITDRGRKYLRIRDQIFPPEP